MAFRTKSASRALDELEYLIDHWQLESVEAVDNILDMRYFDDMLPALAHAKRPMQLFYEVKANLQRRHIEILRDAGVRRIQPGIESMSDHVLKLMRKGTTALRNVQLLKWCREFNIAVDWNILYGFPGETRADYCSMLNLLQAIRFLQPPVACGPIRLDRFSPYFEAPSSFGISNVRPIAPYRHLYPFDSESLRQIAYYFDFDYEVAVDPNGAAADVIAYVAEWQRDPEIGLLYSIIQPDGTLILMDSRTDAALHELTLSGPERVAYEYCDGVQTLTSVVHHLSRKFSDQRFDERLVLDFLEYLVATKLMVTDGVHYLSLAICMKQAQPISELPVTPRTFRDLA
jgi:ribosomal peptide maturation radical SAM protein 1